VEYPQPETGAARMPAPGAAATMGSMVQAPWTYELPAWGSFAENLDDYEACTADGGHAGLVTGLVQRDGALYVLIDAGPLPPLVHRRLAVRWTDVAAVDHDALVVRLAVDRAGLDERALALDPEKARHGPGAEAARVRYLPAGFAERVTAGLEGPVDRLSGLVGLALAFSSPLSLLLVVSVWSTRGLAGLEYAALAAPALLAALAFILAGYRLYREPHRGQHAVADRAAAAGPPRAAS
jgi:hypothetical protein